MMYHGTRATRWAGLAVLAVVVTVLAPVGRTAAQQLPGPVVSADWLAEHLDDPDLVLLHVGPADTYASGHIPGARHIRLSQISAPEDHDAGIGLSLQMPAPHALADSLERFGIRDGARVVVYHGTDWISAASRVLLTLDWVGLGDRAALLDGGMQAWTDAGHPVTSVVPAPAEQGPLTPRVRGDLIVSAEWVNAHRTDPKYAVIDARAPVHFDGIQPTYLHRQPVRNGRIPGAVNIPYNALWDDRLMLKSGSELRALFTAAGVRPGQIVVGYCHLGQFASALLLGARAVGYDVRLYDGSFQEWGSREDLPVEGPGR